MLQKMDHNVCVFNYSTIVIKVINIFKGPKEKYGVEEQTGQEEQTPPTSQSGIVLL